VNPESTLEKAIQKKLETEVMERPHNCTNTENNVTITKTMTVTPQILIVQVNRFQVNIQSGLTEKLMDKVTLNLKIAELFLDSSVNHIGESAYSGHCVSNIHEGKGLFTQVSDSQVRRKLSAEKANLNDTYIAVFSKHSEYEFQQGDVEVEKYNKRKNVSPENKKNKKTVRLNAFEGSEEPSGSKETAASREENVGGDNELQEELIFLMDQLKDSPCNAMLAMMDLPVTLLDLIATKAGQAVKKLHGKPGLVGEVAGQLVMKWSEVVWEAPAMEVETVERMIRGTKEDEQVEEQEDGQVEEQVAEHLEEQEEQVDQVNVPETEDIDTSPEHTKEDYEKGIIKNVLPEGREYLLDNIEVIKEPDEDGEIQFEVTGRANVKTKVDVKIFLGQLYQSTGTTFNIESGKQDRSGAATEIYGSRKCMMNVHHFKHSKKEMQEGLNRNCPAKITFKLDKIKPENKKDTQERKVNKQTIKEFPFKFTLSFVHNHQVNRHEHSKFNSVSAETKDNFIELFEQDLTPAAAWKAHRDKIIQENPETYHIILGNRQICPDYFWPFRFYRKWITSKLGDFQGIDAYRKVEEFIEGYEAKCQGEEKLPNGEKYSKVEQTPDGQTCIVIVDAFMRRVHKMVPQSGDLLIMDATSNIDRSDSKIFHLMCPAAVGGLPLATMVTTREDEATITFALKLLQTVLPPYAFYGRGPNLGPNVGLTDDSAEERNSLRTVWPQMELLLCHFHILQAHWQWIYSAQNHIEKNDKPKLLQMMRKLVYSETENDFDEAQTEMEENPTFQKYPNYEARMELILQRKDEWSLVYRINSQLPTNNVNVTNYVESSFRETKENQFNRHRAFNLVDLVQIVCDDSKHYANKCIDIANNQLTSRLRNQKSRFLVNRGKLGKRKVNINPSKIVLEEDGTYAVPSETKKDVIYTVDMTLRICSCPHGMLKGPCKHRNIVSTTQNIPSFDVVPEQSPEMRAMWMHIGTGKQTRMSYFMPLCNPKETLEELCENNGNNIEDEIEVEPDVPDVAEVVNEVIEEFSKADRIVAVEVKLENVMEKVKNMVISRIPHDITGYEKALNVLEKHVGGMPLTNDAAIEKALCTFGQNETAAVSVRKRKKSSFIPVQVTARSRRKYTLRGSRSAIQGAPRKETRLKQQLVIDSAEREVLYHKLPSGRKKKKNNPHNLMESVAANRGLERKY
jgi:hypothetical protein